MELTFYPSYFEPFEYYSLTIVCYCY